MYNAIDVEDQGPIGSMLDDLSGFRVLRFDARGHGRSGAGSSSAHNRWDQLGHDVIAVARALEICSAVLGGASMGAVASIFAALSGGIEVDKLLLLLPPTAYETRIKQRRLYRATASLLERLGKEALVRTFEQYLGPTTITPGLEATIGPLIDALRTWDQGALMSVIQGAAESDLPPCEELRRVRAPTLIIAVESDDGHPLSTAHILAENMPNATLNVVPRMDGADLRERVRRFLGS
jgi:pimeloyl-ACP methyl ester carboxylesterase